MGCGCGGAKLSAPSTTNRVQSASIAPNFQNLNSQPANVVRSQGLDLNKVAQGTQPARVAMTRPTV